MKVFSEIIKKRPTTKSTILSGVGRLHLQVSKSVFIYLQVLLLICSEWDSTGIAPI